MLKKFIDIFLSLFGIIVVLPFFPIIALIIKLDSKGPVFYLCNRVGKDMKVFKMYKFRTMIETRFKVGESISPQYDPRVTTFGRFLRRTKMNELPQLINILKGEMTFVGPRPEALDLAELYPEKAKEIFSVKPGLVGPNDLTSFSKDILGRNEEELYPPGVDIKKYYIEKILPKKVDVDLQYIRHPSLFKDLKYIFLGVKETLTGALSMKYIQDNQSQIYLFITDIFLSIFSYIIACIISLKTLPGEVNLIMFFMYIPIVIVTRSLCYFYFGMYNSLIRYISYNEILGILKGVTCGSLFLILFSFLFGLNKHSKLIALIDWSCLIFLLSGLRFGLRFYWEKSHQKNGVDRKHRVLIFGAGDAGNLAYQALVSDKNSPFEVVGFIDDAPDKYGKALNGLKVMGNRYHIQVLAQLYKVEEILLAMPEADPDEANEIIEICQEAGLRYRVFSSIRNIDTISRYSFPIRKLQLSDILPLQRIHMDYDAVKNIVADRTVLVNGSGGALGLELCQKALQLGCKKLIIVDRYEAYLTELVAALSNIFSRDLIVPVLVGTDEMNILDKLFDNYRPNVVFQASMKKYVPFFEVNFDDIGRSNYLRTFNLAKVASKYNSDFFILISSLVASNGGNFITESLRVAELSLKHFFSDTNTRLIIARISDIVENRGGIVSVIENQISKQETVTLPSPEAQTCLISNKSAAEFILQTLVEAIKLGPGEGIFVCEPGSSISLIEVTRKLANLYGLKIGADLAVKYTAQSKNHITLPLSDMLSFTSTSHRNIKVLKDNGGPNSDKVKAAFKEFVFNSNGHLSTEGWKRKTKELLNLC